ncbi:MAG: hypothetical protein IJD43_02705, partial [Thermoguttaceae bacterium]|nr:hypothetical protein [Thermoguttaceae bacterium]
FAAKQIQQNVLGVRGSAPENFTQKIEVLPPIGKGGFKGSRAFFYGHYAEGAPNATANFEHSLSADRQCFQRKIGLGVHCCWMDLRQTTLKYNKVCRQSFSFQAGIFVGFFLPFSGSVSRLQHYFFFRKFFIILEKNQEIPKTKRRRSACRHHKKRPNGHRHPAQKRGTGFEPETNGNRWISPKKYTENFLAKALALYFV